MTRRARNTDRGRIADARGFRRRAALIAAVLFVSYAYFHSGGGWNQNSRFDLVRAIVEQGTLRIDAYHENTGDKSVHGGHVYSDKAPGASLTAVPAVAIAAALGRVAGADPHHRSTITWLFYVATVAAAALPGALLGLTLFVLARRIGTGDRAAGTTALIAGLGTPIWAHATLFWGHVLAAACLTAAALLLHRLSQATTPREDVSFGALLGGAAGWAVVTEFPAAIPAMLLAITALVGAWAGGVARVRRVAAGVAIGAAPCALLLAGYQWLAFGSPFHLGYASLEDPTLLDSGFFGITAPKPRVLAEILWGSYRGLLPLAPAVVAMPAGLWMLWRRADTRPLAIAVTASAVYYVLLNAAYEHWEGGWSYGPRHLTPAVALAAIGLAPVLTRGGPVVRALVLAAGLWGAAHSLIAVSTTTQPPSQQYWAPMRQLLWPAFVRGDFSLNTQSALDALPRGDAGARAAFNLGELVGLRGHASLLPLAIVYVLAWRTWRSRPDPSQLRTAPAEERHARGRR